MRLLIQRVLNASVIIDENKFSSINKGLVVFIGISKICNEEKIDYLVDKLLKYRIFESEEKGFDLNVEEINGDILLVSQFTLFADTKNGRKPSFNNSMKSNEAEFFYKLFIKKIKEKSKINIKTGKFQAMMKVELTNDGPVTLMLEK